MSGIGRAIVFASLLASAACSPPASTPPANNAQDSNTSVGSSDSASGVADEARIFIVNHYRLTTSSHTSKLDDGTPTTFSTTNQPSEMALTDAMWKWRDEGTTSSVGGGITMEGQSDARYSVAPSSLSLPVQVKSEEGYHSVKLECAVGKCIDVDGWNDMKLDPAPFPNKGRQPMERTSDAVYLSFDNAEEAQRVGKAVTVLLERAGAKQRRF